MIGILISLALMLAVNANVLASRNAAALRRIEIKLRQDLASLTPPPSIGGTAQTKVPSQSRREAARNSAHY